MLNLETLIGYNLLDEIKSQDSHCLEYDNVCDFDKLLELFISFLLSFFSHFYLQYYRFIENYLDLKYPFGFCFLHQIRRI